MAEEHIGKCDYLLIRCPNMCRGLKGEEVQVLRKDVKAHLEKDCNRRLSECPHCKEVGEHLIVTGRISVQTDSCTLLLIL